MNNTVLIAGAGNNVARLSFNAATGSAKVAEFEPAVGADVKGNVRINCLSIVNFTLKQMAERTEKTVINIYTVGLVSDMVAKGTFKFWLEGGHKLDGTEVTETEIAMWREFADLYTSQFLTVNIKNISTAALKEHSGFRPTEDQVSLDKLVKAVWARVKTQKEITIEDEDIA